MESDTASSDGGSINLLRKYAIPPSLKIWGKTNIIKHISYTDINSLVLLVSINKTSNLYRILKLLLSVTHQLYFNEESSWLKSQQIS